MRFKYKEWIYDIVLIILVASPTSSIYYVLMVAATLLCIILNRRESSKLRNHVPVLYTKSVLWCILLFISCLVYVASGRPIGDSIFRAVTYAILFICFPIAGNVKIHNVTIYGLISYLFASQLCYVLSIGPLIQYFSTTYPMDADTGIYSQDYLINYGAGAAQFLVRLGGYLYNPNSCSRMYHMLILLIFAYNDFENVFKSYSLVTFSGIALLGILFTGSRTGLLLYVLIILYYLYTKKQFAGKFLAVIGLLVFLYVVIFLTRTESTGDMARSFQLGNGLNDSFSGKIANLFEYLNGDNSLINLLFGRFNQHYMSEYIEASSLDSEYGIAIFAYGFIGLFIIISYFYSIVMNMYGKYKIIYVIFLWMVSASLLFSFRTSMLFIFVVSIYYSKSQYLKCYGK